MGSRGAKAGARNPQWKGGRTIASNGYVLVKRPEHSAADSRGYVYEHRLAAEKKIGRALLPGEIVHHVDGIKTNNAPENLEVLPSIAHHRREHASGSQRLAPGQANRRVECACGCGRSFRRYDRSGRPRRFVSGHNMGARRG